MDIQPTTPVADTPTVVETQPSIAGILEILAGGFNEIADDAPMFI